MREQAKNARISRCHLFSGGLTEEKAKIAYRSAWKNIPCLLWDRKRRSSHFPSRVTRRVHRARRSYKITFLSLSLSLPVYYPPVVPPFPHGGVFSFAVNKEREKRPRAEIYLVLLILGKFQWTHCENPEGMEIRHALGERRLKDRKTVKRVLRRAEYKYSYAHPVSLVSLSSL